MPITIKSAQVNYKDQYNNYVGVDVIAEKTTAEMVEAIEDAGEQYLDTLSEYDVEHIVVASDTQPTAESNRLWIDESTDEEVTIPTNEEFQEVKSALNGFAECNIHPTADVTHISRTVLGITYTWDGDTCHVEGTATSNSNNSKLLDINFTDNKKHDYLLFIEKSGTGADNVCVQAYPYTSTSEPANIKYYESQYLSYAANVNHLVIRLNVPTIDVAVNCYITVKLFDANTDYFMLSRLMIANPTTLPSIDLNDVRDGGSWLLSSSNTYQNIPAGISDGGFLLVIPQSPKWAYQIFVSINSSFAYARRSSLSGAWNDWTGFAGNPFRVVSGFSASNKLTFADMPLNSHARIAGDILQDAPDGLTSQDIIIVKKIALGSGSSNGFALAIVYAEDGRLWIGRLSNNSLKGSWHKFFSGNQYVNDYTFNTSEDTYNITATPQITTDNHNYLASTGDTTDRKADIQTMLETGECHLGPGDFYINSGVFMAAFSRLVGCGQSTRLILSDSVTSGSAVTMRDYCVVQDLRICRSQNITLPATEGAVHGIAFTGTQTPDTTGVTREYCTISDVIISNFNGGGITCRGTGYSYANSLNVSNVVIRNCYAGINISYFSEFNKFVNVNVNGCTVGCVDNGGNNVFSNCVFAGNRTNILMDNSTNQSPNNSHATFSACLIAHAYSDEGVANQGTAIRILNIDHGEIFNGCQIHYGKVEIDNSKAIRFGNCQFGNGVAMEITDSQTITFLGCSMHSVSRDTLEQSGNTTLKFTECYTYDGDVFDPLAS